MTCPGQAGYSRQYRRWLELAPVPTVTESTHLVSTTLHHLPIGQVSPSSCGAKSLGGLFPLQVELFSSCWVDITADWEGKCAPRTPGFGRESDQPQPPPRRTPLEQMPSSFAYIPPLTGDSLPLTHCSAGKLSPARSSLQRVSLFPLPTPAHIHDCLSDVHLRVLESKTVLSVFKLLSIQRALLLLTIAKQGKWEQFG